MTETLFSAEFFRHNREQLRKLVNAEVIVITANGVLQRSADTVYPFQQDTNFWYVIGIDEPDVLLVMDVGEEYIILPKRSYYQDTFDGMLDTEIVKQKSGIKNIYSFEEGWKKLKARISKVDQVATIAPPPHYIDVYGMYTNPARRVLARSLREIQESIKLVDIREHFATLRMIKQPAEIEAIKRAIAITGDGLAEVIGAARSDRYKYEYEVEADLTRAFRHNKSDHAFDPIIAGGARACTLHNTNMSSTIHKNELLLFDIGASYKGYAADITRTIAIGKPTKRQQAVYDAVKDAQEYAYSLLKPGVDLKDYELKIEHYIGEKLVELGVVKKNESSEVRKYYPHAASHHLGLDVHDIDDRKSLLAPNMVITVEPGIYIPEEGIGVRIEDDVRITEDGIEVLSAHLPSQLD